jgi:methionyl-tRNA formyltransferase
VALRLVFMGTPDFAVPTLVELVGAGHEVAAVYTRAPQPAGRRGLELTPSPVAREATRFGLPILTPKTLKDSGAADAMRAHGADAAVVVAYGLILPKPILDSFPLGCFNLHASLLPRWRGAAPIQRALLAGDAETGITIMQMDEGLDTGPMLLKEAVPIGPSMTAQPLQDRLAALGARLILAALEGLAAGRLVPQPQPAAGVTYAKKLRREEAVLDWRRAAASLERQVRAFDPWPGAVFTYAGERIKVLAASVEPAAAGAAPGTVLDAALAIACGEGTLRLLRLQRPGRAPLAAEAFLRGYPIAAGTALPCPATS